MTSRIFILGFVVSVLLNCTAFLPVQADIYGGVKCSGDTAHTAVCRDKDPANDPLTGANGLLQKITNIVAIIAGAAAVIIIIISGLRYITSGGDSNAVSNAKNALIGALIGLTVIVLARALISFVLRKL